MEYLERIETIGNENGLLDDQKFILKSITDPLFNGNSECRIRDIRDIIAKLVENNRCEDIAELIQKKWEYCESDPNAYGDFDNEVICG